MVLDTLSSFPHRGKQADLTKMFWKVLKLSNIGKGNSVAVYTDTRMDPSYPDAWVAACNLEDVEVFKVTVPYSAYAGVGWAASRGPAKPIMESLKKVDMVVETDTSVWLYTPETSEILNAGGRILLCYQPEESIRRMFPNERVIRRVMNTAKIFEKAGEIRVTSPLGTDFTCDKKGRKAGAQTGTVPRTGMWDHLPSAQVGFAPLEDSMNGSLVLPVGTPYFVANPSPLTSDLVKFTVKDGKITKIEGKSAAKTIETWLAQFKDERSYIIAHVCLGCHDGADWAANVCMEWESYLGSVLMAFGANYFNGNDRYSGLGGANHAPSHLDMAVRGCSMYVDGQKILEDGNLIHPDLK